MTLFRVTLDIILEAKCSKVLIAVLDPSDNILLLSRNDTAGNRAKFIGGLVHGNSLRLVVVDAGTGAQLMEAQLVAGDNNLTLSSCGGTVTPLGTTLLAEYTAKGELLPQPQVLLEEADYRPLYWTAGTFAVLMLLGYIIIRRATR